MGANFEINRQNSVLDAPDTFDVIGGRPADSSAAIYATRAKLKTLVIDKGLTTGALGIIDKIANYPKVAEMISGTDLLKRIPRQEDTIPVSGAFIYLQGGKPITDFIQGQIHLSESGCIDVKEGYQTGISGTYAAGDVICNHVKQVIGSTGEGAQASIAIEKYLRGRKHIVVDWHKLNN